tara:strand:- start:1 stop:1131 length:1131 start_codon:yes stop_codon:yes gene_type:complete
MAFQDLNPPPATTVKLGSVNFPKLMRHLRHRTNQVRDLVFIRDPIFRKEVMTTKADSASGRGSGTTSLSGPAVSFGYEESSSAAQSAGTDAAYHANSPEMIIPGFTAIQSPIISRSGKLERTGHRISGECTFYMPPLEIIRTNDEFNKLQVSGSNNYKRNLMVGSQFNEIETYDKFIDMERIWQTNNLIGKTLPDHTGTGDYGDDIGSVTNTNQGMSGVDRLQLKVKITTDNLTAIKVEGTIGGNGGHDIIWNATDTFQPSRLDGGFTTIDLPLRNISVGDTAEVILNGEQKTFTVAAGSTALLDIDKAYGGTDANLVNRLEVTTSGSNAIEIKDICFYKQAEWRVESIKEFRDEYMEIKAVRVRGDRTSRRRAYG